MPATTLAPANGSKAQAAPVALVPFTRAAKEHIEQFSDISHTIGSASSAAAPIDIPAYGYLRGVYLLVTATGGTGTVAVAEPDAPFSALQDISIQDVNGAPIVGPVDGYELYLLNKWGGYFRGSMDPRQLPDYSATATSGDFTFLLYIPIEVGKRDGLGSLANMNGASTYKLRYTFAAESSVYSTNPTTAPSVEVKAFLDAWTPPTATDAQGNAQATEPPANGTTSYWSKQIFNLAASGQQTLALRRVGNYIRNHIYIFRDSSGDRAADFPDPLDTYWDSRLLKSYAADVWRTSMSHKTGFTGTDDSAGALDTGVYVEDYMHEFDGKLGYELRDGWLPTTQSTRLELVGSWGAAGTVTVITNDVSPAGQVFV